MSAILEVLDLAIDLVYPTEIDISHFLKDIDYFFTECFDNNKLNQTNLFYYYFLVEIINNNRISGESNTKLHFIIGETLGTDIVQVSQTYFDFNLALDSVRFYKSESIPNIDSSFIPNEISNVKFECDISSCQSISLLNTNSRLYQSLRF